MFVAEFLTIEYKVWKTTVRYYINKYEATYEKYRIETLFLRYLGPDFLLSVSFVFLDV